MSLNTNRPAITSEEFAAVTNRNRVLNHTDFVTEAKETLRWAQDASGDTEACEAAYVDYLVS